MQNTKAGSFTGALLHFILAWGWSSEELYMCWRAVGIGSSCCGQSRELGSQVLGTSHFPFLCLSFSSSLSASGAEIVIATPLWEGVLNSSRVSVWNSASVQIGASEEGQAVANDYSDWYYLSFCCSGEALPQSMLFHLYPAQWTALLVGAKDRVWLMLWVLQVRAFLARALLFWMCSFTVLLSAPWIPSGTLFVSASGTFVFLGLFVRLFVF